MRRAVLLLVVAAAVLALAGGVVLAAPAICPGGGGDCVGSRVPDTLSGTSSDDQIAAMEGGDTIDGSGGSDEIYGDEGNDTIDVKEGVGNGSDTVHCGPGTKDKVFFDKPGDNIARDCEIRRGS